MRPHAGSTRKGKQRKPSAYDRNVSLTASGRRFVIVDRSGHRHELPLARPHKREDYAVTELMPITYTVDDKTGPQQQKTHYLVDGHHTVLAVVPDDDWDHGELKAFTHEAGLAYSPRVFPTDDALHEALPVLHGTLEIASSSGWLTFALLVVPVLLVAGVIVGVAAL